MDTLAPEPAYGPWMRMRAQLTKQAWVFGVFLLGNLIVGLSAHGLDEPGLLEIELFVWALVATAVTCFAAHGWRDLRPVLGLPSISSARWLFIAVGSAAALTALFLVFEGLDAAGYPLVNASAPYLEAGWSRLTIYLWLAVAPAIVEEVAFRGLIQQGLTHIVTEREAWILQGVLFGVAHLFPLNFATHTALGLVFGWVRLRSGSIYPSMLLHGLWNAWVVFGELA